MTSNVYPAVMWPSHQHDLAMSLDLVLYVVQAMVGTIQEEPYVEPTQAEIDEWMIGMMDDRSEGEA
jgi:hypothetical protein